MSKQINVALIGNPNTGKTSLFNTLTGLRQKVGNYPGITVEKKEGICKLPRGVKAHIIDLPGTYSLNANSLDENVVIELLLNKNDKDFPDVAVVVTDVENLKRNLLLFTQIKDLNIPAILVINMADRMYKKGIKVDIPLLEGLLGTKIALISARKNTGIEQIKELIINYRQLPKASCIDITTIAPDYFNKLQDTFPDHHLYKLWLLITQDANFVKLDRKLIKDTSDFTTKSSSEIKKMQHKETVLRYKYINEILKQSYVIDAKEAKGLTALIDRILTHKIWGYVIFFLILLTIFQVIFDWSSYPMDFIDGTFAHLSEWIKTILPEGVFTNLIAEGIIPGLGGIIIFIPQIAFLFLFIACLEESGYMSRVVFLMDRIMRKFGLSGKSVVPLISGMACAIPAVMATRNIENWKERLITILITPFVTCAARLPVYLIIIALVIPNKRLLGMNLQGLTLMALYLLGFAMAIFSAWLLNKILVTKKKTFFVIEMPNYKMPLPKNVFITVVEKTKGFVFGAGKVIIAISVILWFLASNGPSENFKNAATIVKNKPENKSLSQSQLLDQITSYKLQHSYIGVAGKSIEPTIAPLGYDWKIGIAIISSFAAREVFVGSLSTIYSVGSDDQETIKNKMANEKNPITAKPLFNLASGISLLLFYAFAMQCMSTIAIVRKETNTWKWPILQLVVMTGIAYLTAFISYQLLK